MRVGLSILTHSGHNIWNNGIGQNIYFLARCIESIPFVEKVLIINCGDQNEPPADSGELGAAFPLISLGDALHAVDVAIEMGGALGDEWKSQFRARGGRIAFHNCGQPYAALIEPHIFNKSGCFVGTEQCDELWLLPKDWQFSAMQSAIYRCQAHQVPYLWAPDFLLGSGVAPRDLPFGYQPGSLQQEKLRPAIFEPNISPIKMGIIPLFICEEIERRSPDSLSDVCFMNGAHMLETATFKCMTENLDLSKSGKLKIKGREYFSDIMRLGSNLVISHQLECSQNYLYLDALYGGYPLIHNSPEFSECGYYFDGSDIDEAVEIIDWALRYHDSDIEAYNDRARQKIAAVDPLSKSNRDVYARRLLSLTRFNHNNSAVGA